jgi:hypothetical protein
MTNKEENKLKQMEYIVKEEKEVVKSVPETKYQLNKEYLLKNKYENFFKIQFNKAKYDKKVGCWEYFVAGEEDVKWKETDLDKYIINK